MTPPKTFLEELAWRGLLYQQTDGAAQAFSADAFITGYCGFDPTAASLHAGNLVPVMGLVHLQRTGHRPIVLVGGGTGLIGDPSGKVSERPLASAETIEANAVALRGQLERFLEFTGPRAALMKNNADWLVPLGALAFMRDVGKHFSVNVMLAKDSVKSRLEEGISYTEFSYMLLQAYDFLELHRREGCTLQIGGSDQWGNITAGTELVRRSTGGEAHGVTLPLVTNADGKKFGKTESGSVWLDPRLTSPFRFFQFWINTDDRDAGRYLRYFTLLGRPEIEAREESMSERPEAREAQSALAMDVTARVHGADAARLARDVSRILFDRKADPRALTPEALEMLSGEIPFRDVTRDGDGAPALSVVDALVETGLAKSKGDARRQVQQGGVSVNGRRLGAEELSVDTAEALHGAWYLIRKGGREVGLVRC
jgi:tyrosyl-tRNA synthetase